MDAKERSNLIRMLRASKYKAKASAKNAKRYDNRLRAEGSYRAYKNAHELVKMFT